MAESLFAALRVKANLNVKKKHYLESNEKHEML